MTFYDLAIVNIALSCTIFELTSTLKSAFVSLKVIETDTIRKLGTVSYSPSIVTMALLWAPAQRKRATMLYFANVFFIYFFMAALFSGPG